MASSVVLYVRHKEYSKFCVRCNIDFNEQTDPHIVFQKTDVIVNEFPLCNTLLGSLARYRATFPVSILFVLHDGEMFQLKNLIWAWRHIMRGLMA